MMGQGGSTNDAYMDAFMNGFEFVLLAIRGRLAEGRLDGAERERLEAFLADYWRIAAAYHDRREAPARGAFPVQGRFVAELVASAGN